MLEQVKKLPLREEDKQFIQALENQANQKQMTLGVFGSFSVGKSALINALIGQHNILPTHTNETTAIPTFVVGGEKDRITAIDFNGVESELSIIKLHSLTAGGAVNEVEKIIIERSTPSWLKEITFIDTPGRNTKFQAHISASEQALITSDAALYVMPWQGLTLEDIVYLKHILRYQPNIYFVINKVDRIDESQGISIEEMKQRVASDLKEQIGKEFPVFAVSATTGYNINKLYLEFILPLKNKITDLKEKRLQYALQQFLLLEQQRITQQIELYETALSNDSDSFEIQKKEVQLQYEQANIEVSKQIADLQETMVRTKQDMKQYIHQSYEKLEVSLKNLVKEDLSIDVLTLKVEDLIVSTRNTVFEALRGRLQKVVGEEGNITLQSPENASVSFHISVPNLTNIQRKFESERERAFAKILAVQEQLKHLPMDDGHEEQRGKLQNEIENLTEQAMEKFVPEYIYDETFDQKRATKIASAIGFVGDMALTVGLAMATAGASAAAQVGGKVVAKEATKAATKEAAKAAAKEAAKKAAKKAALEATEKAIIAGLSKVAEEKDKTDTNSTDKEKQSDNFALRAAKALDQFTSPVQTIATKIGEQIDQTRNQPKQEDLKHRRDFFERKMELETQRDDKIRQLEALQNQANENERVRKELSLKRDQIEKTMENKLKKLEDDYNSETKRLEEEHFLKEISAQVEQVLSEEEEYLNLWFRSEFENVLNAVTQMMPKHLKEQLQQFEEQIEQVEQLKKNDASKIQRMIDEGKNHLSIIEAIINGEMYEVSK